jgi:hypothetical protein
VDVDAREHQSMLVDRNTNRNIDRNTGTTPQQFAALVRTIVSSFI